MRRLSSLLTLTGLLCALTTFAQSDDCVNAVMLTPTLTNCQPTPGSSGGATQSLASCSGGGVADDDVWYSFVANSTTMTIDVDPTVSYDAVIQLFSGGCGGTSIACEDVNGMNGDETLTATGLTIGNTYHFRVYHYGAGSGSSTFTVCVFGLAPPTNNLPCNAFVLPPVTPACQFQTYTNAGSAGSGIGTPSACGGTAPFQGGYAGGEVWFKVEVPASGILDIHTLSMDFADGAMALYSGTCGALTQVECDDDDGPGLMPYIYATGLTPGDTLFIRMWEYGNNANGNFGICVSTPDNDDCVNALEICDLNGYGGITSAAYTIDRPDNMAGMGELPPGPFGTGYTGMSPVTIDNNHWLKFTASGTTAVLFVDIHACALNLGMQMQIFSGSNCTNFAAVSNFLETTTSQTVTATGLVIGQQYYIMVDGFAGDVCSYTITATSGVQVVDVVAAPNVLCAGDATTINANVTGTGTYTYSWSSTPGGGPYPNGSTLNVSPTTSTEYTVQITGVCGSAVTSSVTVLVNPLPSAVVSPLPAEVCLNETLSVTGTPSGGSGTYATHVWSGTGAGNLNNPNITNPDFTTGTAGTYGLTYTVTDNNGCTATDNMTVTVNPVPDPSINASGPFCVDASPATLSAITPGGTFSGNGVSGNTFDPATAGVGTTTIYYTVTNAFSCTRMDSIAIVVNPLPDASINAIGPFCEDASAVNLTAATPGGSWSGNGVSGSSFDPGSVSAGSHLITYNVTDGNSCSASDNISVQVNALPDASISAIGPFCVDAGSTTLSAGTAGGTFSGNGVSGNTFDPGAAGVGSSTVYYAVTDANSCSNNDSLAVLVNALPDPNINPIGPFCTGDASVALTAATAGGSFSGNGVNGSTFDPSTVMAGSHDVIYNVTDGNGCSDADTISVLVSDALDATISPAGPFCEDALPANLSAVNGGGIWSGVGIADPNAGTFDPSLVGPGTYLIVYTIAGSCGDVDSLTITVDTTYDASISGVGPFCAADAAVTLTAANSGGTWSGNGITDAQAGIFDPATAGAGTHVITYTITAACGDMQTTSVVVNPNPLPPTAIADTLCDGGNPLFTATGSGGTLNWYDDANGLNLVQGNSSTYAPNLGSGGPAFTFYVEEVLNGCSSISLTAVTAIVHDVTASFTATPDFGNAPLTVDYTNTSTGVTAGDNIFWDFGDGNTASTFDATHDFLNPGTYVTTLTVTTADGLCTDSFTWTIIVEEGYSIEVPNVFSPNLDGTNDFFNVIGTGVETINIDVFNRWGQLLATWGTVHGGWDGYSSAGVKVPDGTYYYLIVTTDAQGEQYEYTGHVQLIR